MRAAMSFRSPFEHLDRRKSLAEEALPRLMVTYDLLPPATAESHLLELGAMPFISSLCLATEWPGRVTYASYFGTSERHGRQTVFDAAGATSRAFEYDLFNIEVDEFPYPDETFDVVLFCELIEHLAINPVWALGEIHRVLKPDGHVILTTPNALALERVASVLSGQRPFVDRYNPAFGYGARHNREYSLFDLAVLFNETGYHVEVLHARDLDAPGWLRRAGRSAARVLLRPFADQPRRQHLFLRARRGDVFRWRYPDILFEPDVALHFARRSWMEVGVNDTMQCEGWWHPPMELPDGTRCRRLWGTDGPMAGGSVLLRVGGEVNGLSVRLRGDVGDASGEVGIRVGVARPDAIDKPLGVLRRTVPCAEWTEVHVPFTVQPTPGEMLLANIAVTLEQAILVERVALV